MSSLDQDYMTPSLASNFPSQIFEHSSDFSSAKNRQAYHYTGISTS